VILCLRSRNQALKQTLIVSGIWLLLTGCNLSANRQPTISKDPPVALPSPAPQPQSYTKEAQLIAVGDIMMHGSQIQSGYDPTTQTYNYSNFFTQVKDILSQGNWVMGNLETPIAGAELKYTGYPLFNAPDSLADSLKAAGFNVVTTANNHALDRGEIGLRQTLENIQKRGLYPVGTHAALEDAPKILILEKNEIKMAILAYSYGTNGIPLPAGKDYLVSLINEPQMIQDISRARAQGADIVTVALHFGIEYQRQPNAAQKRLVENLVKAGADIVLGSHPHVVQPYEIFELPGASGKPRKAAVIYSMGNFISNQRGNYKDLGVIFQVTLSKKFPEATTEITNVQASPTWVHRYVSGSKYQFQVLPLQAVITAKNNPLLSSQDYSQMQIYLDQMNIHLNSLAPNRI
jgi:poly-gamma-glutamate capsule biosynthesis protein CapA/YwtB (metallophosphatase superfamily)